MQVYEVHHNDLEVAVRYKVLASAEVDLLLDSMKEVSREAYKKMVLETVLYNLLEVLGELKGLSRDKASAVVTELYNGAVMLNPGVDVSHWLVLTRQGEVPSKPKETKRKRPPRPRKISRQKFLGLHAHLQSKIVGQDYAIDQVVNALKRSHAGLNDPEHPQGIFLFCGASGVGKSHLAKVLHEYLYGERYELVRIDCGEYQHKHENSKLIGSPAGYIGYEDGGQLTNKILQNRHTVVLLDEVEKAHPDVWNTFLRVFDEGKLTDSSGQEVDFTDTIIIMTTNLGNREVADALTSRQLGFTESKRELSDNHRERLAMEAIRKHFTPELLNRIDKIVLFNALTVEDFRQIAEMELNRIDDKLAKRGFSLCFDDDVLNHLARLCSSTVENARKISQIRRELIEPPLADCILENDYVRGTIFSLTMNDSNFMISAPSSAQKKNKKATIKP